MSARWIGSAMLNFLCNRKREIDHGASCITVQPKSAAMGFDDRPAQGQPDAEPLGLLGRERQKRVHEIGWESRAVVGNSDFDTIAVTRNSLNADRAIAVLGFGDRFDRVPHEIEQGL